MSHPRTHDLDGPVGEDVLDFFSDSLHRPLLIVGNGPSAAVPRHDLIPDDPVVFRMNWFFLEDRYHFGRTVDAYFFSIPNRELEARLRQISRERWYDLRAVFSPMRVPTGRDGEPHRSALHEAGVPEFDHWNTIAKNPVLARFMMSRPLPTQGMQVLATALTVGFRDITLCGIDMYESSTSRYGYAIPDEVAAALETKDLTPGYESFHALDRDIDFLDACVRQYPDASIRHVGPSRHLAARLPTPPVRERACTFGGVAASDVQIERKSTFAAGAEGRVLTLDGESLPYRLIDGKRCGFVTLVSGPFHHGARALARSLAKVSDVPLTVMCAPSADRGALRASGIAFIDVPEIKNPNVLGLSTQRFASTYTKLNAFRMTHLDRCVYIDSDMIALRPIDDLFRQSGFQAVPDHGLEHEYDRFNSGLFAFEPDAAVFEHLMSKIETVSSYDQGDQGFLNEMFPDWHRLPHEYNVSKRWSVHHPNLFHLESTRVVHFVGIKPWQPEPSSAYDELYRLWFTFLAPDELVDVTEFIRQSSHSASSSSRRLNFRRRRTATAASDWNDGSLLRRVQARHRDSAFPEALELIDREWPGDEVASPGLRRERAKARLLNGDINGSCEELRAASRAFPAHEGIRRNLALVERVVAVQRVSGGVVRNSWIAAASRVLERLRR